MKTNIALLSDFLPYPYALFRDDVCIFESQLSDTYTLNSLMKHVGNKTCSKSITVKYFRGMACFSIKAHQPDSNYTLMTILKEKQIIAWSSIEQEQFYILLETAAYLISIEKPLDLVNIDESDHAKTNHISNKQFATSHQVNTDFQDNYQLELNIMSLVQKGDTKGFNLLLNKLISVTSSQLSADILTDRKYKLIALLTMLTRASIKQGCSANLAYRLSDSLIQTLDKVTSMEKIRPFTEHLLLEFSNLNSHFTDNYDSELVNSAIAHIHANLYDPLTNYDIADTLSVNPTYLSSVFKKTTNISLHQYIIREKIAEAQYLLSNTDFPLSIISQLLHFSNQSHFCKLFKLHTSYTPKEFRLWF
ncbi:MAG: AraC family transcriptional regulator [Lactococcus plantarum]|nr:AraC family transcriptional regulator [Lactococcus plantarum]MDN6085428.1 AraC family transcriptional regulator [Lactococcus plantarum]